MVDARALSDMKKLKIGVIGIGKIGLSQIKAIKTIKNSGYADFEQGHRIVRIVEAAIKSQQSRTWVTV